MKSNDIFMNCKRCGRKAPVRDMMYDIDGKNFVCNLCLGKGKTTIQIKPTLKKSDLIKYFCFSCRYSFSRRSNFNVKRCPYCGESTVFLAEDSIQDIINEF